MQSAWSSRAMGALALAVALASAFPAAQDSAAKRPDLSGFWVNQYTPNLSVALGGEPPFTAFGAERWRTVDTSKDPTAICLPVGPSRGFTAPFPFLLVQGADTIGILFEYQSIWRAIYMDGRTHPDDVAEYPYFMGHSVGRWEGSVLVVDTIGIDERSWLDTAGHEHSAKLRLTERFEKTGPDRMQWTVIYDDPVYFTRPWSITRTFTRGKPDDRLLPYTCNENNKDVEHLQPHQPNLNYKHVPEPAGTKPPPKPPGPDLNELEPLACEKLDEGVTERLGAFDVRQVGGRSSSSDAPGMAPARNAPSAGGVAGSWVPVTTSVRAPTPPASTRRSASRSAAQHPRYPVTGTATSLARILATVSGCAERKVAVNHRSIVKSAMAATPPASISRLRSAHDATDPIRAAVFASTRRSTRSGACTPSHRAVMPPSDTPATCARASPARSISDTTSRPRRSSE